MLAQVAAMLVNRAEDQLRLRQYLRTAVQPSIRADDDCAPRPYVRVAPAHNSTKALPLHTRNSLVYDTQYDQ